MGGGGGGGGAEAAKEVACQSIESMRINVAPIYKFYSRGSKNVFSRIKSYKMT